MTRRPHGESGQASAEFMGWLFWILLAGIAAWQLLLAGWTKLEATNSARTASRVVARADGDPRLAARNALPQPLRAGVKVDVDGEKVTVRIPMPVLIPSLSSLDDVRLEGTAELPS